MFNEGEMCSLCDLTPFESGLPHRSFLHDVIKIKLFSNIKNPFTETNNKNENFFYLFYSMKHQATECNSTNTIPIREISKYTFRGCLHLTLYEIHDIRNTNYSLLEKRTETFQIPQTICFSIYILICHTSFTVFFISYIHLCVSSTEFYDGRKSLS